jgi:hypothetical protein
VHVIAVGWQMAPFIEAVDAQRQSHPMVVITSFSFSFIPLVHEITLTAALHVPPFHPYG